MPESGDFEGVETLEDYNWGLAASRVESQEACYIRRLVTSFKNQVAFVKTFDSTSQLVDDNGVSIYATPIENTEEEIGSLLYQFCGDLAAYNLVKGEKETEEGEERDLDRRQISLTFRRCTLLCFLPVCYTTTVTLATGSSITFGWAFSDKC